MKRPKEEDNDDYYFATTRFIKDLNKYIDHIEKENKKLIKERTNFRVSLFVVLSRFNVEEGLRKLLNKES